MCADPRLHRTPLARTRRHAQRGVSLVELMVGLTVSLIIGIAAAGSAVMFTASQRQGIGVGGVAVNINTALAALKNDASTGGLGFFGESRFLCASLNLGTTTSTLWDGTAFAPVTLTRTGTNDAIDVLQSTRVEGGATVALAAPTSGADAQLKSYLPTVVGDAVLISPATPTMAEPCLVRSVTATAAGTPDTPQLLTFGGTGAYNAGDFATNPTYNTGGVTLLGQLGWQRYRLQGTNLLLERPIAGASAVLARNVMALRAQYGVSAPPPAKTLQNWVDATGGWASLTPATIAQVRAVRVGVVTRSPQREKPDENGNCTASTALPQLFGAAITPDVTDWQCYRFRTAMVVIPMRNIVMGIP